MGAPINPAATPDLLEAALHMRDLIIALAPNAPASSLVGRSLAVADAAILKALGEAELDRRGRERVCREYNPYNGGWTND